MDAGVLRPARSTFSYSLAARSYCPRWRVALGRFDELVGFHGHGAG